MFFCACIFQERVVLCLVQEQSKTSPSPPQLCQHLIYDHMITDAMSYDFRSNFWLFFLRLYISRNNCLYCAKSKTKTCPRLVQVMFKPSTSLPTPDHSKHSYCICNCNFYMFGYMHVISKLIVTSPRFFLLQKSNSNIRRQ